MSNDLERYGVFALIFVVLLIVGISIWGPQREDEPLRSAASASALANVANGAEEAAAGRSIAPLSELGNDAQIENLTAFYKVQDGDNPTKIARKLYGSDRYVPELMAANPGVKAHRLRRNDLLRLPTVDKQPDARFVIPAHELAPLAVAPERSTPESGAKDAQAGANAPAPQSASGGTKAEPKSAPESAPKPALPAQREGRYHVVRPGERLEKIAKRYYGSAVHVAKIRAANPAIKNPNLVLAGTKLALP